MTLGALGLLGGLILAAVFGAAGIAKLADQDGTRTAVRAFGAPRALAGVLALVIPAAELAVTVLLLAASTRVVGAAGALVLLGVFSTAIAVSLARGRTPDCHCFGQLHSAPAGWKTLGRNALLAGLAAVSLQAGLAGETPSTVAWRGALDTSTVLSSVAMAGVVALAVGGVLAFVSLLRSYGRVLLRLEKVERRLADAGIEFEEENAPPELGHEPGTPAPVFVTTDTSGDPVTLDALLAPGLPLMLLFTSPSCGPCQALMPDVGAWQVEHADRLTIAIANGGDRETSLAEARAHGLERVLVDDNLALHEAYEAGGTPSAVLIAPDGTIASHVTPGAEWIEQLLSRALDQGADDEDVGLPVGAQAPDLTLPTLDGEPFSLASTEEETVVLFWNPDCGFCSSMRDELLSWERHPPVGAPRLVVVSSGDEASTRREGFSSTVVLDPEFTAGTAFGAGGTPMAVLLDRAGRISSPSVAGAEAVFALAGGRHRGDAPRVDHIREGVAT